MKFNNHLRILITGLALLTAIESPLSWATNYINTKIAFQGILKNANGSKLPDGNYNLKFLIKKQANIAAVWSKTLTSVSVLNGLFTVYLTGVDDAGILLQAPLLDLSSDTPGLALQIDVLVDFNGQGSYDESFLGIPITAVPTSLISDRSNVALSVTDGSITTASLADGSVSTAKLIDGAVSLNKVASGGATLGQILIWNGSAWIPGDISSSSVTQVTGTAPIAVTGTASNPIIGIATATDSTKGAVQGGTGVSISSGAINILYGSTPSTAAQGDDSRLSDSRIPTGTAGGDLSGTYPNPVLSASGATAGTYTKITIDAKGRATSGAQITYSDLPLATDVNPGILKATTGKITLDGTGAITLIAADTAAVAATANAIQGISVSATTPTTGQALQYSGSNWIPGIVPLNRAGDTLTGSLGLPTTATLGLGTYSNAQESTLTTSLTAGDMGKTWYNTTVGTLTFWTGTAVKGLALAGAGMQSLNGLSVPNQTFAHGFSGTAPLFTSTGLVHTLNIPMASDASVTAGLISNIDYAVFNTKQSNLGYTPVNRAGDSLTGSLILDADPTQALGAVTKQYLEAGLAAKQDSGNYISALSGDVTAAGPGVAATTVGLVGGSTASNIHNAEIAANAATSANTANAIVARDSLGNFSAGTINATSFVGSGASLSNLNGSNVSSGLVGLNYGGTGLSSSPGAAQILIGNAGGTAYALNSVSGDVTLSSSGAITVGNGKITNAMLAGSIDFSKLVGTDIGTVGTVTTGTWNGAIIAGTYGGTGVNNGAKTITVGGNVNTTGAVTTGGALTTASTLTTAGAFTTAGANALTLTTTADTNVTLPTSGTLVNSAVTTLSSLDSVGTITSGTWNGSRLTSSYIPTNVAYTDGNNTFTNGTWNGSVIAGTYGGTGVNNGANTITVGGNVNTTGPVTTGGALTTAGTLTTAGAFTTAGANALTLTTTADTNVTLPTSGTLVNSGVTTLSSLASIGIITSGTWNGSRLTSSYIPTNVAYTDGNNTFTNGTWNGSVIAGTYGGTGVNNGANTITVGGNVNTTGAVTTGGALTTAGTLTTAGAFTTAGANALTLTTTADTNVTLPTSGTLVNSGVTTLSSLASVGTITSGTWNGSRLTSSYIPTNVAYTDGNNTFTNGTWNGSVIAGTYGGTGVNNGANTITVGGNVNTTGAFNTAGANALTLTTTADTNVTLPTSGTLVNSGVTTLSSLASIGTITTGTWNGSVITGTYGGTGVNNGANTITVGGNVNTTGAVTTGGALTTAGTLTTAGAFTTAGANALTLTTTADTNITLPTSGTLVNSAVTTLSSLDSVGTITSGTWNGSRLTSSYIPTNVAYTDGNNTFTNGTWNGSVIAGTYGGTGVNNGANTITLGGNVNTTGVLTTGGALTTAGTLTTAGAFTTAGANALTLTTTADTNVTLPTSGTLVNSAVTTLSSLASVGTITTGIWNAGSITSSGTVTASRFIGTLTGASSLNVLKSGDTITGLLNLTSAGTSLATTGNVGIGTTTATHALEVNGNVNFTGSLTKSGILQPTVFASGSLSAVNNFDIPVDISTYNSVEIRFEVKLSNALGTNVSMVSVNNSAVAANFTDFRQNYTTSTNVTGTDGTNILLSSADGGVNNTLSAGTITLYKSIAGTDRAGMRASCSYYYALVGQSRSDASGYFSTSSQSLSYIRLSAGTGTISGNYTVIGYP
jgi:hypothetical protein